MTGGAYKVKINDGSVVGPMDIDMLRSWHQQGLLDKTSPVLSMRTNRWCPLREVLDVGKSGRGRSQKERDARAKELAAQAPPPSRGGRTVAGAFLILGAAASIAAWLMPTVWRADLSPAPWREIGYGQLLLGLTALHDANWTRRFARLGVCLAGFAIFPLIGILIAQGVRLDALAVLGSAWLMTSGLFFLLSPSLPTMRLVGAIAAVLAGGYGVFRFGVVLGGGVALHVAAIH